MVTDESVEFWGKVEEFPIYFVSRPPHYDTLTDVYYKVTGPDGQVFWRREGDETSRSTTMFDLIMEEKTGFGIQKVKQEYTPWAEKE